MVSKELIEMIKAGKVIVEPVEYPCGLEELSAYESEEVRRDI